MKLLQTIKETKGDLPYCRYDGLIHLYDTGYITVGGPGNDTGELVLDERMRDELVEALNKLKF